MNYIKGKFKQVIFDSETGYKVGLFKVIETDLEDINKVITYTGYFYDINNEDTYKLYGNYIFHDRYGYQFNTKDYEKVTPEGKDAIIEFLTSSFVKGCGEKTAKDIYDLFGDDSLNKIKENKDNLFLVPKMTIKKCDSIYNSILKYFDNDKDIIYIKSLGFSVKETMNLINKYGKGINDIINDNIYILKDDIDFKKLDKIFLDKYDKEDSRRVNACLIETMKYLSFSKGDIYLYKEEIIKGLYDLYRINIDINNNLINLFNNHEIIINEDKYYLTSDYEDELDIAEGITYLLSHYQKISNINKVIEIVSKNEKIKYNNEQKRAIETALANNVSIITGGPGTGKTTIINGIISCYAKLYKIDLNKNNNILLLAPTGRASKKMSEATLYPASTIHRFLKWDKEKNIFGINELNKLHYNLIIIDETSMIDNHLLASLFRGLDIVNTQIVFVGDEYQLPSVSPGLILNDLIKANIPHIRLEQIYRQSDNSYIPILAKNIKEEALSEDMFIKRDDFAFIETNNKMIKNTLLEVLHKMEDKGINESNIQVLAPMYKGENGIDNLNNIIQDFFNPVKQNEEEVVVGPITYRVGDKILNLVNDLDNNIYNGDIGYIDEINKDSKLSFLTVNYYGHKVEYKKEDLINITHAYAISIHKSQGSEFDHIIMPISNAYNRMLYNKLLYTGVSRAKQTLILIGSKEAFKSSILNNYSYERKTSLYEKIMNILQ